MVIHHDGQRRRFEVAADELEIRSGPRRGPERLAAEASLDHLRARAALRAAGGEEACLVLYEVGQPRSQANRRVLTREVVVQLAPGADPSPALAGLPDAINQGAASFAPGCFLVASRDPAGAPGLADALRARPGVRWAEVQLARHYELLLTPNDPYFVSQWHLLATPNNAGANAGHDLNVTNVWDRFRGAGITIGVLDSGVELAHPDLAANINAALSHDFVDNDADANPSDWNAEKHGTAVAGIAAAVGNNRLGVAGVAYEARLAVHRLITGAAVTDAQIASAFAHRLDVIPIKNNSWGSPTGGSNLVYASDTLLSALANAAETGRAGRGTIYVFACGNDGDYGDDVNYNGLINSIYAVPAAALDQNGTAAYFSDPGAALVVAAPCSASGTIRTLTTDLSGTTRGYNQTGVVGEFAYRDYTQRFSGTSAAAPMVSGVVALMLQANPNLGWRDVQEILLRSASKTAPTDPGWATNSGGMKFHHRFGGGMLNASNAVALATNWVNLPPATRQTVSANALSLPIPDNNPAGVTIPFVFAQDDLRAEHVRVRLDVDHTRRGDLVITLTSPGGMVSRLADFRGDTNANYKGWTFTSRAHWGERANGTWTLRVADALPGQTGVVLAARVEVLGTYADPLRRESSLCTEVPGQSNQNGYPDPGETVQETVRLQNTTAVPLSGVSARLSSSTPGVTILNGTAAYPAIAAGQLATNTTPFEYRLAKSVPCGSSIQLSLVISNAAGQYASSYARLVGRPVDQPPVTNLFESADVPKPIPDITTIYSTDVIQGLSGHILDDVDVQIRLDHTAVGDLQVALMHPDGTEVILADHAGGNYPNYGTGTCGVNLVPTVFDDAANTAIGAGAAPFAGRYHPSEALAAFNGKPVAGNWRLRVSDTYDNDSGTLLCWSLRTVSHAQTIACEVLNVPPGATNVSLTAVEGMSTNAMLAGADADGDPVYFVADSLPSHGQISALNSTTGAFTYQAFPGYSGPDSFTFEVRDPYANSATATVSITILPAPTYMSVGQLLYQPGFGVRMPAEGVPGFRYFLEATTDFLHWDPVMTNTPAASPFWLFDLQTNYPYRFYRLRR
jgi:subtilisin-like proprotein convertase family protein/subtilisin family serine protease